jgi:hypothetical protein
MQIKNRKERSKNRANWEKSIKEAKAHLGLQCHPKKRMYNFCIVPHTQMFIHYGYTIKMHAMSCDTPKYIQSVAATSIYREFQVWQ